MSRLCDECVELQRQNAIRVPKEEIQFDDDEEAEERVYQLIDRLLKEEELKEQERHRINKLKQKIKINKNK